MIHTLIMSLHYSITFQRSYAGSSQSYVNQLILSRLQMVLLLFTDSHLADCEEALHSPPPVSYDLPLPPFPPSMEKRRDKPLPPPRMTSKAQPVNKTRYESWLNHQQIYIKYESYDLAVLTSKSYCYILFRQYYKERHPL